MAPDDDDLGRAPTASSDPAPDGDDDSASPRPSAGFRVVGVGATLGRYELLEELGEGGMATVYRARDRELRRDVAIKVLFPHLAKRPDTVRRFDREARAAAGLEHANILRVYDVGGGGERGAGGDPPYIVMELVRGTSLKDTIDARGPLLAELCACAGALLADALAVAHGAGVVHRDVKPANVMIATGGTLLLADFGVARVEDDDSLITRTGALLGTPAFMSPEQATGTAVDARTDVYSLGATLYQLATGVLPYSGTAARVVAAIAAGELVPPARRRPTVGTELSKLIERMMATDVGQRPATAAAAAAELRALVTAAGLGDPADELAAYFADPAAYVAAKTPIVVNRLAERARAARAEGKLPRAIALIDRASALAPDDPAIRTLVDELAARRGGRTVIVAGAVAVALAVGGFAIYRLTRTPAATAAPDAGAIAVALDAAPVPVPAPPDAAIAIAVADAAMVAISTPSDARAPAARADARVAARPADARSVAVAALPDAAVPRDPPDAAVAPARPTAIKVTMDSWCELSIDGTGYGQIAGKGKTVEVTPGDHDVVCVKEGVGGARWSQRVHVDAGQTRAVTGKLLRKVRVTIATARPVTIGGTTYSRGDTVSLDPIRVRVEQAGTSTYIDIPRVPGCTLQDTGDADHPFDCFR